MGFGIRAFLLRDDGHFTRLPYARFERLWHGEGHETLPDQAGRDARFVLAYLETEDRGPVEIRHLDYLRVKVTSDGRIDMAERDRQLRRVSEMTAEAIFKAMETGKDKGVIRAADVFLQRQHRHEALWQPTRAQLAEIKQLVFSR